jgi:hypothetical protein
VASTASRLSRKSAVDTDGLVRGSPIGRSVKVWKNSRTSSMK